MSGLCKTCRFAKWQLTAKGNVRKSQSGRCTFVVDWPAVPLVITRDALPSPEHRGIWMDEDEECEVHEPVG